MDFPLPQRYRITNAFDFQFVHPLFKKPLFYFNFVAMGFIFVLLYSSRRIQFT